MSANDRLVDIRLWTVISNSVMNVSPGVCQLLLPGRCGKQQTGSVFHMKCCALCRKPTSATWQRIPQPGWPKRRRMKTLTTTVTGTQSPLPPRKSSCHFLPLTTPRCSWQYWLLNYGSTFYSCNMCNMSDFAIVSSSFYRLITHPLRKTSTMSMRNLAAWLELKYWS